MIADNDSVTTIHKRWHLTSLNPFSYKTSLIISIITSICIIAITHNIYLKFTETILHAIVAVGITIGGIFLDFFLLKGTPLNKISKVIHVAAFSNSLWLVTILLGLFSIILFNKNTDIINYIIEGMFLASGLRYAVFVSVFGSRIIKSICISFILPLIFFVNTLPYSINFEDHIIAVVMGSTIYIIVIIWCILSDRAGYPNIKSTFKVLQAFLYAWTENRKEKMETILELRSKEQKIKTIMTRFEREGEKDLFIILSDIHPGPFNPIGGSNLPYRLFNFFENNAIILHSTSDHSLNLPTTLEVNKYLESLKKSFIKNSGNKCTYPLQINSNGFTLTCLDFTNSAILIISKDKGMEDLPYSISEKIGQFSKDLGFSDVMIVDAHNVIGKKISIEEEKTLIDLAVSSLKKLKEQQHYTIKIGYANYINSESKILELGEAGLGVINFNINNKNFLIGWSDSNNLVDGLRQRILCDLNKDFNMLEICSSDTHYTSGKRTRSGYYSLGNVTSQESLLRIFREISQMAITNTTSSKFTFLQSYSTIKLMGQDQFNNYAIALDKSMNITKISLIVNTIIYIIMLFIS